MKVTRRMHLTRTLARMPTRIRNSLWFLPMVIVFGSVGLAIAMIWLDDKVANEMLRKFPRIFGASADSERTMLAAIATSMITVAGVTFSITMVAVSQSANQYTSRVLGNFMRDRTNQIVLGVFVGVYTYCLIVVRTIRGDEEIRFVPALSSAFAFVLALTAMGFLIYFIHHVAQSLQSSTVVARVREETEAAIERLFPDELGEESDVPAPVPPDLAWIPIPSDRTGYIESVKNDALLHAADRSGAIVRMERGVGEFVVRGETLFSVSTQCNDKEREMMQSAFIIEAGRTVEQDAVYGVRQMVDVALKAISPASNNTTTAIRCIDHLSAVMCQLAERRIEGRLRQDEQTGQPRVIARGPTFQSLMDTAFDEIRNSSDGNISILERMLASIDRIATFTRSAHRRQILLLHIERLEETGSRTIVPPHEAARFAARCRELRESIRARPVASASINR